MKFQKCSTRRARVDGARELRVQLPRELRHALAHNAAQLLVALANPPSHLPLHRPRLPLARRAAPRAAHHGGDAAPPALLLRPTLQPLALSLALAPAFTPTPCTPTR